jgi:hypothetical protein
VTEAQISFRRVWPGSYCRENGLLRTIFNVSFAHGQIGAGMDRR